MQDAQSQTGYNKNLRKPGFLKNRKTSLDTEVVKLSRRLELTTYKLASNLSKRLKNMKKQNVPYGLEKLFDRLIDDVRKVKMNVICGYDVHKTLTQEKHHHYSLAVAMLDIYESDLYLVDEYGEKILKSNEIADLSLLIYQIAGMIQKLDAALPVVGVNDDGNVVLGAEGDKAR